MFAENELRPLPLIIRGGPLLPISPARDPAAMLRLSLVLLLLFVCPGPLTGRLYLAPSDKLTISDDYDRVSYPSGSGQRFSYWEEKGVVNSTGRQYTAHIAVLSEGLPTTFTYALPFEGQRSIIAGGFFRNPPGPAPSRLLPWQQDISDSSVVRVYVCH